MEREENTRTQTNTPWFFFSALKQQKSKGSPAVYEANISIDFQGDIGYNSPGFNWFPGTWCTHTCNFIQSFVSGARFYTI